jgi:hypothetical protein
MHIARPVMHRWSNFPALLFGTGGFVVAGLVAGGFEGALEGVVDGPLDGAFDGAALADEGAADEGAAEDGAADEGTGAGADGDGAMDDGTLPALLALSPPSEQATAPASSPTAAAARDMRRVMRCAPSVCVKAVRPLQEPSEACKNRADVALEAFPSVSASCDAERVTKVAPEREQFGEFVHPFG